MKLQRLLGITFLSLLWYGAAQAQQPYGGCWHPDAIKNWSPQTDPNAKFNRSRVPLAPRFKEPTTMKANKNQYYEGQVCNASILFPTCSLCPSQGANNFVGYQPTYWQYMDKLVYWAGSASEGIIIPPPAGSIDAAHAAGVKVLGQIFFPPSVYGGKGEWVGQMLTKQDGKFIYAIKLYEIAKYLGFDGWFINQETPYYGVQDWAGFVAEFNRVADAAGDTQMEIQWYNASGTPNAGILKAHKNTSQFLEYGSVGDYRSYANSLNCKPEEVFGKIYSGIQTVSAGLCGFGRDLRGAFPTTGHIGSVDLFCPEERIWKDNVKDLLDGGGNTGRLAYAAMQRTFNNEEQTWVNKKGDPSQVTDDGTYFSWPGLSGCIVERSAIQSMPFISDMSVGVGKYRFVKGTKLATQDWYHSGMQSVLPTWRWWIENKGNLKADILWDDAYNVSNAMRITGTLSAGDHLMRLYKTQIKVTDGGTFRLVYKTNLSNSVEVKLGTESKVDGTMVTLTNPTTKDENGWTVAEYDLSAVKGQTVYMIAVNLKADVEKQGYVFTLGQVAMIPANYTPKKVEITNLTNTTTLGEDKGDLRITWDWADNADLDHFDIYIKTESTAKKLVGQTRGEAFYVPTFQRSGKDKKVEVSLVPIMKDGSEQTASTLDVDYPKPQLSVVTVKPSKSYVRVGDEVTLKAKGTGKPTGWKWNLPASLELLAGQSLTSSTIKVKAKAVGTQQVTIEATNEAGTGRTEVNVFDVLSGSELGDIKNVALNKTIKSYSGATGDAESPRNIIDGVTYPSNIHNKWCNINSNHECVIDLQNDYRIYGFKIYDCKAGPEQNENFDMYRIYLSEDGVNWKLLVDEQGRVRDRIKEDYISPTKARYVKLNPYSETGMTLRIWEFEVFGVTTSSLKITSESAVTVNTESTKNVVVTYDLNGEARQEPFTCKAIPSNGNISVGNIVEDRANHTFTIPVIAGLNMGEASLKVTITNGKSYKEQTLKVTVDNPNAVNVLAGMQANLIQYPDGYSLNSRKKEYKTNALTDGNKADEACGDVKDPCRNKNDFWAIFKNNKDWNLSKVKIHIPKNNQGTNDNDQEGTVNQSIEIRTSNNGKSWKTIHTFENIGNVSELEYILPEYLPTTHIAIVCTLNSLFYPSLAEVEAFEQDKGAIAGCVPVEIKDGFTDDVIVEALPADKHVTKGVDAGGWTFYTKTVEGADGGYLPEEDRVITVKSGNTYKLAPFTAKNALILDKTYAKYTINFAQPETAEHIYVLYTSTGGGNNNIGITPIFDDGSEGEEFWMNGMDWYGYNDDLTAVGELGRIMAVANESSTDGEVDEFDFRKEFRLFEYDYEFTSKRKVKALRFRSLSYNQWATILAISKFGLPSPSTGVKEVQNTTSYRMVGIYNAWGMKLNKPSQGLNIIKYSDGTTKKVWIK